MVGCTTPTHQVEVVPQNRPQVQESLMAECPAWEPLQNKDYSEEQTLDLLTVWITSYQRCKFKHGELVKFIRSVDRK